VLLAAAAGSGATLAAWLRMPANIWPGWDGALAYGRREQRRGPSSWPAARILVLAASLGGILVSLGWEEASCEQLCS